MQAYTGDTRAKKTLKKLADARIGRLIVRGRLRETPPEPWVYDNGAFGDWKAGIEEWNTRAEMEFEADVLKISKLPKAKRPAWIALPDIVGKAERSSRQTAWALLRLRQAGLTGVGLPFAYVVQDGMSPELHHGCAMILKHHRDLDGVSTIFVGGSTEWKWATAGAWAKLAHSLGMKCHVGRAGSIKRVEQAAGAGADSIDSCLPLWSAEMLARWTAAIERTRTQLRLFGAEP